MVAKSVDQSIPNNTTTVLTWATEIFDTDSYWDAGNSSRLTVLEDGFVQLFAGVRYLAATDGLQRGVFIHKNGALAYGCTGQVAAAPDSNSSARLNAMTPPMQVVAGDFFESKVYQQSGASRSVAAANETYFGIRKLPSTLKLLGVRLSADESIANNSLTYVPWDSIAIDTTGGLLTWASGDPTSIVIGAGVSKVKAYAGTRWNAGAGSRFVDIDKTPFGGAPGSFSGGPVTEFNAAAGSRCVFSVAGPEIDVDEGDKLHLQVRQVTGGAINLENTDETFLVVEIVA